MDLYHDLVEVLGFGQQLNSQSGRDSPALISGSVVCQRDLVVSEQYGEDPFDIVIVESVRSLGEFFHNIANPDGRMVGG